MTIVIYIRTKGCPICKALKNFLTKENLSFQAIDIATPTALTELTINNVFTTMAPVLQIGYNYYKADMFSNGITLQPDKVKKILEENGVYKGD